MVEPVVLFRAGLSLGLAIASSAALAWPEVPLPEDSQGEVVSRHMNNNGMDMRASRFVTLRGMDEVKAFYRSQWLGQIVENQVGEKTVLAHAQGDHFITVELDDRRGVVEGTIGVVRLLPASGQQTPYEAGEGFDRPVDTDIINDIRYLDGPGQARTLGMENGLSPYVNRQFHVHRLRMRGWRIAGSDSCSAHADACAVRFEKADGSRITMSMMRSAQARTQIVVNIE